MELVVFSGIQGAGKSTFYQQRFAASHVRINLDMLRTRNREDILLFACLAAQQAMVIDNTNPTASQRSRYAMLGKAAGFRTTLYFFRGELEVAIKRNAQRFEAAQVPEIAIRGTHAKLQTPTITESFDQMFCVTANDGQWVVEEMRDEVRCFPLILPALRLVNLRREFLEPTRSTIRRHAG